MVELALSEKQDVTAGGEKSIDMTKQFGNLRHRFAGHDRSRGEAKKPAGAALVSPSSFLSSSIPEDSNRRSTWAWSESTWPKIPAQALRLSCRGLGGWNGRALW